MPKTKSINATASNVDVTVKISITIIRHAPKPEWGKLSDRDYFAEKHQEDMDTIHDFVRKIGDFHHNEVIVK